MKYLGNKFKIFDINIFITCAQQKYDMRLINNFYFFRFNHFIFFNNDF